MISKAYILIVVRINSRVFSSKRDRNNYRGEIVDTFRYIDLKGSRYLGLNWGIPLLTRYYTLASNASRRIGANISFS